ncbi:PD-(D/E)XK motif protein [Kytococcus sedentarius]|uniref:PD-(D/E)XK motif protein n=1 Tax=Kytococcus sedentarius TaxID=1276 RepID=UPI0035BC5725
MKPAWPSYERIERVRRQGVAENDLRTLPTARNTPSGEMRAGVDGQGRSVLVIPAEHLRGNRLLWETNGISIESHQAEGRLILRHQSNETSHQFALLCDDLIDALSELAVAREIEECVMSTVEAWADLFRRVSGELSRSSVLGLAAELLVLRSVAHQAGHAEALEAWTGPSRARHDFQGPGGAVEVKATSANEGFRVTFHGLRQLELPGEGDLYVLVRQFEPSPTGPDTLATIVASLPSELRMAPALTQALLAAGCEGGEPSAANAHTFHVREERLIAVDAEFPRITVAGLERAEWADSLVGVRYQADLARLTQSEASAATVLGLVGQ